MRKMQSHNQRQKKEAAVCGSVISFLYQKIIKEIVVILCGKVKSNQHEINEFNACKGINFLRIKIPLGLFGSSDCNSSVNRMQKFSAHLDMLI